jgi:hypothetical protein
LKRILDSNVRMMGLTFRQSLQWTHNEVDAERKIIAKKRGIAKRIVNLNTRLIGLGFNKLVQESKYRTANLKEKLRFVITTLTDKDLRMVMLGYNGLKQRTAMLNGVGIGDGGLKKVQLIKRLTNQGYNLQVMAINTLNAFLTFQRAAQQTASHTAEMEQKEKDRVLRRILDSNVRMMGLGFRQSLHWMHSQIDSERKMLAKKRGIAKRIVEVNARLMGMGLNKLVEEYRLRKAHLREKLRFLISTLADSEKRFTLCAYNGMRQHALALAIQDVGVDHAETLKTQLIKRLTNQGYNLQVMAINSLKDFLAAKRLDDNEKKRILKRILDSNVRMMGLTFRQSLQWTHNEVDAERKIIAKKRGIAKRIVDVNARLMGMGLNKLVEEYRACKANLKEKLRYLIAT